MTEDQYAKGWAAHGEFLRDRQATRRTSWLGIVMMVSGAAPIITVTVLAIALNPRWWILLLFAFWFSIGWLVDRAERKSVARHKDAFDAKWKSAVYGCGG